MSNIDLIRQIHVALRDFNTMLKDYDISSDELARQYTHANHLIDMLNAYSYEHCKTFYTHYHITENRKGYCLGADLREKR